MINDRNARRFFAGTSALVTAGLILQVILSATHEDGAKFATAAGRVFNFFCFFTVQSNIVVAITTGMLATRLDRTSTVFRTFRLVGIIAIAVTGLVFYVALKDLQELTGWDALADLILHTLSPILTVVGFLVFGPRRQISTRELKLVAFPPLAWLVFTLIRGAIVEDVNGNHYYPYPFLNVEDKGYAVVFANSALVVVLFIALCAAARALDPKLPGVGKSDSTAAPARG